MSNSAIKFCTKDNETLWFCLNWDGIEDFCAATVGCNFFISEDDPNYYWDKDEEKTAEKKKGVAKSRLYHALMKEWRSSGGGMLFMGDVKGGYADKYIFSYIPKRAFKIGDVTYKATLSPYFLNSNSGNMVRFLTVVAL